MESRAGELLPVLRDVYSRFGCIPPDRIPAIAEELGISPPEVLAAIAFYPAFHEPESDPIDERLERKLGIDLGQRWPEVLRTSAAYPGQTRRILERVGNQVPGRAEAAGLLRARSLTPGEVIMEIRRAGLRGTGGAGFPTWMKWESAAQNAAPKVVIANAAEGDVGAFVDRALLEGDPYAVIEGMAIAAHATAARTAILYVRAEYASTIPILQDAISSARSAGWLDGIDFRVFRAAGRYVCGEETALLNSMEGKPGQPRYKPPFPVQAGLWGFPTVINNVKTLAHAAWILRHGADEFARLGTEKSKGTAVLSVCGPVVRPGIVEVAMGTPLRKVIEEICGGMADGKRLKAVQLGGPLGGILPAALLDTPISFEHLGASGAPLGSGGMIAIADGTSLFEVVRDFAEFAQKESCGHCAPCRLGTRRLHSVLRNWPAHHEEAIETVAELKAICEALKAGSFCAFGQGVPGILLSALRYFPDEVLS